MTAKKQPIEKEPLYAKECPRCGHPALAHQHQLPTVHIAAMEQSADRICKHPVPVKGREGVFRLCGCIVPAKDYVRVGNHVMIRLKEGL